MNRGCVDAPGTEEPDEGNLHVRICGGRQGEIPGSYPETEQESRTGLLSAELNR